MGQANQNKQTSAVIHCKRGIKIAINLSKEKKRK